MKMKKLSVSLIILALVICSCSKGLDTDLGHDFKGTWKLYQTCIITGCLDTDPDITVTIQFRDDDLVEKQDGLVIGGADYQINEIQDDGSNVTIYVIIVNGAGWQLDVSETTLDITAGGTFRRYTKVE